MLTYLNEVLLVEQFDQLHQFAVLIATASGVEDLEELPSVGVVERLFKVYERKKIHI